MIVRWRSADALAAALKACGWHRHAQANKAWLIVAHRALQQCAPIRGSRGHCRAAVLKMIGCPIWRGLCFDPRSPRRAPAPPATGGGFRLDGEADRRHLL